MLLLVAARVMKGERGEVRGKAGERERRIERGRRREVGGRLVLPGTPGGKLEYGEKC